MKDKKINTAKIKERLDKIKVDDELGSNWIVVLAKELRNQKVI